MLHELIFVLCGFPGEIFVPHPLPPAQPATFVVKSDFPSLHPAERDTLNRLGQLGWLYATIKDYTRAKSNLSRHRNQHGSVYLQALVSVLEATLDDYRRDILSLEERILNKDLDCGQGVVPLSLITAELGGWELLLPALVGLVHQVDTRQGSQLFDLLFQEARSGHAAYRAVIERMADALHDVLYQQLVNWMVYGKCESDDFFIHDTSQTPDHRPSGPGWQRQYALVEDRIPAHIPLDLCTSILFVGKAVATVNQLDRRIAMPSDMKSSHLRLLLSLRSSSTIPSSSSSITTATATTITTSTASTAATTLPKASSSLFSYTSRLHSVVHHIRRSTAHWLFSNVLVGEHSIVRYLDSFRHMFLLGYGDLASNVIDACDLWRRRTLDKDTHKNKKRVSASGSEEHRNEMIFRHQEFNALLAKASVGTDAEDQLDGYSVRLSTSQHAPFDDLLLVDGYCTLRYDMRWPIDLFLGQAELARYSELWSFLIGLKNVQTTLSKLWRVLRESNAKDKDERVLWRLRAQMLYWVGSLWSHVQV